MNLTLEQADALKAVLGGVAPKASARLNLDLNRTEKFLSLLSTFTTKWRDTIKVPYAIRLEPGAMGNAELAPAQIIGGASSNLNLFSVDFDLRLVSTQQASLDEVDSAERSAASQSLEVVIQPSGSTRAFLCGLIAGVVLPTEATGPQHTWQRPMREFAKILQDQLNHAIVREQQFQYWFDRKNRILLSGDSRTERIFQHGLFWWLRKFVVDALDVYAEASELGQDKTDVTVVTGNGLYVIEVKWLGKNNKGTVFNHPPRINQGLEQVRLYLENNDRIIRGHLVVYDARSHDEHLKSSVHDEQFRHQLCVAPHVIFLKSDTPSVLAEKNVKAATKSPSSAPASVAPRAKKSTTSAPPSSKGRKPNPKPAPTPSKKKGKAR